MCSKVCAAHFRTHLHTFFEKFYQTKIKNSRPFPGRERNCVLVVPPEFVSEMQPQPTGHQDISLGLLTGPTVHLTCQPVFRFKLTGGFQCGLLKQALSLSPVLFLSAVAALTRPGHRYILLIRSLYTALQVCQAQYKMDLRGS